MIYYFDVDGCVVSSFEAANNNVKTLKTFFPEKGFLLYLIKQSSELFGKVVKPPAMRVRIEKLIALFENKKPPCYNKLSRPDETY